MIFRRINGRVIAMSVSGEKAKKVSQTIADLIKTKKTLKSPYLVKNFDRKIKQLRQVLSKAENEATI